MARLPDYFYIPHNISPYSDLNLVIDGEYSDLNLVIDGEYSDLNLVIDGESTKNMKTSDKLLKALEMFRPHINAHQTAINLFHEAVAEVKKLEKEEVVKEVVKWTA